MWHQVLRKTDHSYPQAYQARRKCDRNDRLPPAPRASLNLRYLFLGFRFAPPQALCCRPLRGFHESLLCECSGLDCTGTFVIHYNDAARAHNAFRHLERGRDRALGKQTFPLAQSYWIDHQPKIIDQIMLHKGLEQITASPDVEIWARPLLEFGDLFRNIAV